MCEMPLQKEESKEECVCVSEFIGREFFLFDQAEDDSPDSAERPKSPSYDAPTKSPRCTFSNSAQMCVSATVIVHCQIAPHTVANMPKWLYTWTSLLCFWSRVYDESPNCTKRCTSRRSSQGYNRGDCHPTKIRWAVAIDGCVWKALLLFACSCA